MNNSNISNKNNQIQLFDDKQLKSQTNKIANFLKMIKPQLAETGYKEVATEIRPLKRDMASTTFLQSFTTYRLESDDEEILYNYMNKVNGEGFCLYYSVFDFAKDKDNNKINNRNAVYTTILPMDLDNITEYEYLEIKDTLNILGLETIDINTGHGYQIIILLNEKIYDKNILKKFTALLLRKGIPCDPAIIDSARIMRLPFTFNCKCLDTNSKYYDKELPIPIQLIDQTEERYSLKYIFEQLNSLSNVIENTISDNVAIAEKTVDYVIEEDGSINTTSEKIEKIDFDAIDNNLLKLEDIFTPNSDIFKKYPKIDFNKIPIALVKLLCGTPEGLRNQALLFMIPLFRNKMGFDIVTVKEIITTWGSLCKPSLDAQFLNNEVTRIYKNGYKNVFGKWTKELTKEYGYFDFKRYNHDKATTICISNSSMNKLKGIKSGAFRLYIAMMLEQSNTGDENLDRETLEKITGFSYRTISRHLLILMSTGLISKVKSAKKQGKSYRYYINPYFESAKGFTLISKDIVARLLTDVSNTALKLYTYICSIIGFNRNRGCWKSQSNLGESIGKKQSCISQLTSFLHKTKFIEKITKTNDFVSHSKYILRC